mgnify:FL=1
MPAQETIADAKLARRAREDELASDILEECRVQLMLKFRFLDMALWRMENMPVRAGARYALVTDATRVAFDPPRVIARFEEGFDELIRDYLHMVMHCVFRHPFDKDHRNRQAWNLTCDIIAESVALDMCAGRFASPDDAARIEALDKIKMLTGSLLPNKVYALVKAMVQTPSGQQYMGMGRSVLNDWFALFERDDHSAWPANVDENAPAERNKKLEPEEMSERDPGEAPEPDDAELESAGGADEPTDAENDKKSSQVEQTEDDAEDAEDEGDGENADPAPVTEQDSEREHSEDDKAEREWEEISKEIEMNLETFSKEWGRESDSLMQHLAVANRKVYDYTEFLRKFMTINEEMLLNQDEFDYIYYTYGMELYGNMPLVEPLEYKETDCVREFVIAIDTSGSVRGDLVRRFIEHTFDILKESETYTTDVNVHIVQCDARVQSDTRIADIAEVDKLMENFVIRGFGGTDFRPVFDYVETLRERGELTEMKGLIYFTDGLGNFPEKPPNYDTAFVFMEEEGRDLPPVPPWAMKVVIDEAGINRFKSQGVR